jgi:hypothetical protein
MSVRAASSRVAVWLAQHSGSLSCVFLLSYTFFRLFVRPAVGVAFADSALFVCTAALVHTIHVGIGFGLAERHRGIIALATTCCFVGWGIIFSLVYRLRLGRFRHWADMFSLTDAITASVVGAGSLSTWLAVAMAVIRSETGRHLAAGSLQASHVLIAAGALSLLALDATPVICLGAMFSGYAAALVAEAISLPRILR